MNKLKSFRISAGMSQSQLAEATEISVRTIQAYEQGAKSLENAAAITVLKIARVLHCTVEDLIDA